MGVGGHGPRAETVAGDRRRESHPGDGPTRGPPRGAGTGPDCAPRLLTAGCCASLTAWLPRLWALGCSPSAARPTGPRRTRAGWPLPQLRYAQVVQTVRRRRLDGGVIAWWLVPWRPSMPCGLHSAARATPRFWSASTCRCASLGPRAGDGSAHAARMRLAGDRSAPCLMAPIIVVSHLRAYASPCRRLCPPTARARPRRGGPARPPWRWGGPLMSGPDAPCCCLGYRHGRVRFAASRRMNQPWWWGRQQEGA